jgi:branched-subunit amino acid transport protein AzlD
MPDTRYLIACRAICCAITWALRGLPFTALTPLRSSKAVLYLSTRMPAGVMVILSPYTLRTLPVAEVRGPLPPWPVWRSRPPCTSGAATPC